MNRSSNIDRRAVHVGKTDCLDAVHLRTGIHLECAADKVEHYIRSLTIMGLDIRDGAALAQRELSVAVSVIRNSTEALAAIPDVHRCLHNLV